MNTSADSTPQTRLGILQAGRAPEELLGTFPDYNQMFVDFLGADSFDYKHWAVLDNEFPTSIDEADAWLITGSRFGAYEDHPWIAPLEQLIRDVYEAGVPMVGICFGHQIIAQALGGKVEKFSGGWSVGRVEYNLDAQVFGEAVREQPTPLMAFHQDQVVQPPAQAKTIGSTDFCKHAALAYDSRILTIQPHPEFTKPYLAGLLDVRGDILPTELCEQAQQRLSQTIQHLPVAQTMREFLNSKAARA